MAWLWRDGKFSRHFCPEFLNRVDGTVRFQPLTLAECRITLDLTDAAKEQLAREGDHPVYGARPLKRFFQRALETPLSRQLISGEVADYSPWL